MHQRRWFQALGLIPEKAGPLLDVTSSSDAYECLTSDWPDVSSKAYLIALEVCAAALSDPEHDALARKAFEEAAEAAGYMLVQMPVDGPQIFMTVH